MQVKRRTHTSLKLQKYGISVSSKKQCDFRCIKHNSQISDSNITCKTNGYTYCYKNELSRNTWKNHSTSQSFKTFGKKYTQYTRKFYVAAESSLCLRRHLLTPYFLNSLLISSLSETVKCLSCVES